MRKTLAGALAFFYLLSNVVFVHAAEFNLGSYCKLTPSVAPFIEAIPLNYGALKESYANPKNGDRWPFVIVLQDVHLNAEAQQNLANILLALNDQASLLSSENPLVVGVEGAFGAFDFKRFRAFEDKAIIKSIADYFLREKKIAAPSYAGMAADQLSTRFVGIDDGKRFVCWLII